MLKTFETDRMLSHRQSHVVLLVGSGAFVIAIIIALIGWSILRARADAHRTAEVTTSNLTKILADNFNSSIYQIDLGLLSILDEINSQQKIGRWDAAAINEAIVRQDKRHPDVLGFRIFGVDGKFRYGTSNIANRTADISKREDFLFLRDNPDVGLLVGPARFGPAAGKWTIAVSRRINNPNGSFGGAVFGVISTQSLTESYAKLELGPKGGVGLAHTNLQLAARFPEKRRPDDPAPRPKVADQFQAVIASGAQFAQYDYISAVDGIRRTASVRRIEGQPYYILVGLAEDDYLASWRRDSEWLIAFGIFIVSLVLAAMLILHRRISDSQRAEENLLKSEENLRTIADHTYDWEYWEGINLELMYMSPSCERTTGYTLAEFMADPELLYRIIHPDDQHLMAEHRASLSYQEEANIDFRIVHKAGGIVWISHGCKAVHSKDGHYLGRRASNRDITQRKQVEETEARMRTSLRRLNEVAALTHLPLNKQLHQVLAIGTEHLGLEFGIVSQIENNNCKVLAQISPSGTLYDGMTLPIDLTYCSITLEEMSVVAISEMGKSPYLGHPCYNELKLETYIGVPIMIDDKPYGTVNFSSSRVYPRPFDEGDKEFISLMARWISSAIEREKATLELEEARQTAEQANRAKSEFLANMSHEIRTPMNAILGLSDLAMGMELPPKLRNYCTKIYTSSKALLSIINDILDYSKVEAGRLELDQTDMRIDDILENVADLFNARAEEKEVELVLDIAPNIPVHLMGDPLRLGQVMNNLVGNAVKFTEHGEIVIKVEQLALEQGVSTVRFSVRDTGIGMSKEQSSRLFHAFTQADSSITRRFGGTGLGLTISQKLVEKMGGEITVASELGKGSAFSFTVCLPVSSQTHIERSPADLKGMRVLVVDDLDISRQSLRELLRAWGFHVSEAASGQEALALIEQQSHNPELAFELVLLDWKMPEMDGLEVAKHIRKSVHSKEISKLPVIIMVTAYSQEQLLQEARDIHLDAVLTKPVTSSGLFDTIMTFQGGHTYHRNLPSNLDVDKESAPIRDARILLVEDNETNQLVATDLLERMGLHVTVANNGQEALDRLDQDNFDAVLMDVQMPQMDGFEATRRIRQEARWNALPIIAMTAAVMAEDRAACANAGMNDHVSKPIQPQELVQALLKWVKPATSSSHTARNKPDTPSATEIRLPDKLSGFDLQAALGRLGGNSELLVDLLKKFGQQFADAQSELGGLLKEGEREAAAAFAHKIKGAAANLGAIDLHLEADKLEHDLKAGLPDIQSAGFDAALAQVLEGISLLGKLIQFNPISSEYDCDNCDWQRAAVLIRQIRGLVENYEFVPFEQLAELKSAIACQPFQECLNDLERALDHTDYDKAMTALKNISCIKEHNLHE